MGRVFNNISVNGAEIYALFDSGSKNSYMIERALHKADVQPQKLKKSFKVGLGCEERILSHFASIQGEIEGNAFVVNAYIIPALGTDWETKKTIEFIFGAQDMQTWQIKLDIINEKLDLSQFAKEFIEF